MRPSRLRRATRPLMWMPSPPNKTLKAQAAVRIAVRPGRGGWRGRSSE